MTTKTIKRAMITSGDKAPICMLSLQKTEEQYEIGFQADEQSSKDKIDSVVFLLKELLLDREADGSSKSTSNLKEPDIIKEERVWRQILSKLTSADYYIDEIPLQDLGMEIIFDEDTNHISSSVHALHKHIDLNEQQNTANHVFGEITGLIRGQARTTLSELKLLQSEERWNELETKIVSASRDALIEFSNQEDLLGFLGFIKGLDISQFTEENRDRVAFFMFSLAGLTDKPAMIYEELCRYDEAHPDIELNLQHRLKLLKAQGALQKGMPELAYAIYKELLVQERDMEVGNVALLYKALAGLNSTSDSDAIKYTEYAADAFLVAGNQIQASACYCRLADRIGLSDIKSAIQYFEQSESLVNGITDSRKKHFLAQISYRKACLYYQANMLTEANAEIKKSHRYQLHLLGGESNKISVLRLAHILAAENNNLEDAKIFERELDAFRSKYPDHQQWLRDELISYARSPIPEVQQVLDKEVAQNGSIELKSEWYILKAITNSTLSNEDKIALLEQANILLKHGIALHKRREHLATLYSSYGFVYLKINDNAKALSYYRESVKLDPYQQSVRQNYAALLFKTKNWAGVRPWAGQNLAEFDHRAVGKKHFVC